MIAVTDTRALRIPGARRCANACERHSAARQPIKHAAMRHARHVVVAVAR